MNKTTSRILLFGSIISLIYFSVLVIDSYRSLGIPSDFRVIGEMITIPLLLFPFIGLMLTTLSIIRKQTDPLIWAAFGISLFTVVFLSVMVMI